MHDFVIIGSGVSGGRIAGELTRAGARCLLLEAGPEFGAKTFPKGEMEYSSRMFWGGGLEVTADGHLGLLRAKCLGGTSVVNQALLDRFDDFAWDDWRGLTGIGFLNARDMEPHYKSCAEELSISKIPEKFWNTNARTFIQAFDSKGYGWKALERAQGDCKLDRGSDCIVCLGGCPRDSKQSSLVTSIRRAREKGLEVHSEFEAHHLEFSAGQYTIVGKHRGGETRIRAGKVVLAAGAIGNSAILLRSGLKKKLPALGTRFGCHPQVMTYALFDEEIDAHKGAFQAVKSEDLNLRKMGFKLENVYAPPIGTAMLLPGFGADHLRRMRKYRHYASMEVAIRDDAAGVISIVSGDKVRVDKPLTGADKKKISGGLSLVRELFSSVGAREIIPCPQTFGLHLMGGCPIGTDPARSVVSPDFTIHGMPGLLAADSSGFPRGTGNQPVFHGHGVEPARGEGMGGPMSDSVSRHLNARQIGAIVRVGDVLAPGDETFPSFSRSGCVKGIDILLDCMPSSDLGDLKTLLSLMGLMPGFLVALVLRFLEWSPSIPGPLGGIFRLIRIGLRGLIMSLYFGNATVLEKLDYHVGVFSDPAG